MLKVYIGNIKAIKEELNKFGMEVKFSKNIMAETLYGLFYKPCVYYFLYDKNLFPDKETIDRFIEYCNKTDSVIVCVIEDKLDKKTIFYKKLKQYIEEVDIDNNKIDYKNLILKDLSNVYEVDDSKFISILFSLSYTKYGQTADFVLNLILTGRMNNTLLAKKLFIALVTMG